MAKIFVVVGSTIDAVGGFRFWLVSATKSEVEAEALKTKLVLAEANRSKFAHKNTAIYEVYETKLEEEINTMDFVW